MARLTEEMVIARSKQSDLSAIKKLNCWGAELIDVSLLRRMPNVEVLALSINKIRTLRDFPACRRLRELYVRKNDIRELSEIRHLRQLPDLTSLWLEENPCTQHPEYRMTVLRNLPNLEKLDNVPVHPDEVQEAMRRGAHIPDSDDEGYSQQEAYPPPRRRSSDSPRDQGSDSSEAAEPPPEPRDVAQCPLSPTRRVPSGGAGPPGAAGPPGGGAHSPDDERYEHPAMTRSHYDRAPDAALPHSFSTHSVKEYSYSNGECRYSAGEHHGHDAYYERADRSEPYQQVPRCEWEREGGAGAGGGGAGGREREYPSAVMAEHRGFTRRPVARNSNLLSAVLCLVKELDYPSLEVAEMAVRCRMDELANSQ